MSQIKFGTAVESKAVDKSQIPARDGQFIIVTDTKKLMYDDGENRIVFGDIVELDTEDQRAELLTPVSKFYFVKDTGALWRYNSGSWIEWMNKADILQYIDNVAKSKSIVCTLSASGWRNGRNTVSIHGLQATTNGVIGLSQNITSAEHEAVCAAEMYVCGQEKDRLTIAANGDIPKCDIPVVVILLN